MGDKIQPSVPIVTLGLMTKAQARACANSIKAHFDSARALILDLFERRGWQALGYKSWRECVITEFDVSSQHLYRQLEAAKIERIVAPESPIGSIPERTLRPLAGIPPEKQAQAYRKAKEDSPGQIPPESTVKAAAAQVAPPRPKPAPKAAPVPVADVETLEAGIDPPDIARQRAIGIIPNGVVVTVTEPEPIPDEETDEPDDVMGERTDEEYLASCPVRDRLSPECRKVFDRDALLFRDVEPHRKKFQHHAGRLLKSNKRAGRTGKYHFRLSSFLIHKRPDQWVVCSDCKGSGRVPLIGECPNCHTLGYIA